MDKTTYKEQDQIIGTQIGLQVIGTFFTSSPIDNEEDELKLKENVGNFRREVRKVLEETFSRHSLDCIDVETMAISYITPENIDDFLEYEIIE